MVEWHHRLDGHEFEQALGVGDGQGSLECCSLWGRKESDTTERLNDENIRGETGKLRCLPCNWARDWSSWDTGRVEGPGRRRGGCWQVTWKVTLNGQKSATVLTVKVAAERKGVEWLRSPSTEALTSPLLPPGGAQGFHPSFQSKRNWCQSRTKQVF